MAKIMTAAASFMSELMYISRDVVWKDQYTADQNESREYLKEAAEYMAAKSGDLTFTAVLSFNIDILEKAGVPADIRLDCYYDKWQIPTQYRETCVKLQREFIIENYVEMNDYYRMLYGLPTVEEMDNEDFLYNTDYPDISEPNIPIHELDIIDIYALEDKGYIDKLKAQYPKKKYLNHLGRRKIEPYLARSAERFSLLYMTQSEFIRINTDFRDIYAICRYAVIRSIYAGERRKDNEYYDNFMAMLILFMTINQMFAKYLDADVNRDFYDYESIKYVYDHYGVPFYPEIPLNYHIKIIKNINILLRYKGSTEVFYKLFDIFNFGAMEVYDYYLVKVQKMEGGKPVFVYNEDGTENVRAMYDIKFGEVELYNNPPLELSNPENIKAYSDLTAFDPYWDDDDEMLNKLYNMDYNYIESKYIGFSCVFDLMSITYESALFFKLMFDTRDITETFLIYYGPASMNISMYDLIIYICALVCKRYGYDVALNKPALYLSSALGFNTKANLKVVRDSVLANPAICEDAELLSLLTDMDINSAASITLVFEKIESLRELLVKRKAFCKTTEEFHAYSQLEKTLMTSEFIEEGFLRDCKLEYDPSNPDTWYGFIDLLADINPSLATRVIDLGGNAEDPNAKLNVSTIDSEIQTALVTIRKIVTSLEYIEMCCSGGIEAMLNYLFKMLDFFKSAKAQLTGFNLAYTIGNDGENTLKLFYEYDRGRIEVMMQKFIYTIFIYIQRLFLKMSTDKKYITLQDFLNWDWSHTYIDELMCILFRFKILKTIVYETRIDMDLHDVIHRHMHEQMMKDKLLFDDDMKLIYEKLFCDVIEYYINDEFKYLTDAVIKCTTTYHYIERSDMKYIDEIQYNLGRIYKDEPLPIELEEYTRKYLNMIKEDASNMRLDYSPIDLDGDFNLIIGDLGNTLFRIADELMKVSVTLSEKFKSHMMYMLRSLIEVHHTWTRSDLYLGTSMRWLKSHVYLKQLLTLIDDCHKLTTIESRIDYNIDFDSVVKYVEEKTTIKDLLNMGDELELLYEYIEQYYYEYIVNDQFEELIDAIVGYRIDLKEFKKLAIAFRDELQGWTTLKCSGEISYEFERRDIKNEYHDDISLTYDIAFRSLSIENIDVFAKSFCNIYFKHNNLFIKNNENIINEITTLFKHYVVLYMYKIMDVQLFVDEVVVSQDTFRAGFDDSIKYIVRHYLTETFIRQEIRSEFGLWTILNGVRDGITIKDSLTMIAEETPRLLYERIYSEVIDYVINDRFTEITDRLMDSTYEYLDIEKNAISYLTTLHHDSMHSMDANKVKILNVIDEVARFYSSEAISENQFDFSFSSYDLNGDPGILFTILGESLYRLYAEISLVSQELSEKIKNSISYSTKLIEDGIAFILDGTIPMFMSEVHAADRRHLCTELFQYLVKVHKCIDILHRIEKKYMSYAFENGEIRIEIKPIKNSFTMKARFIGDLISDTLQFLLDDKIGKFVIRYIKSSSKYLMYRETPLYLDDEIIKIILSMTSESVMPLFIERKSEESFSTEDDTQLIHESIEHINSIHELGKMVTMLYTQLMKGESTVRDNLIDKLDLMLIHIASLLKHVKENISLIYKDDINLIDTKANHESRLLLIDEINQLISFIRSHNFDASLEVIIKLVSEEIDYDDWELINDEITIANLNNMIIGYAINSNSENFIDAIHNIYERFGKNLSLTYEDMIKIVENETFVKDSMLQDSVYLKDIRNVYKIIKFVINGKYGMINDKIHSIYNNYHDDKLTKYILRDRLIEDDRYDPIMESIQQIFIQCMSGKNNVGDIQEITQPLFLEYRDRVVSALNKFIFSINASVRHISLEYRDRFDNDVRFVYEYIMRVYMVYIDSTMILFDELLPNGEGVYIDELNEYSLKLKRISNILSRQNFAACVSDIIKNHITNVKLSDVMKYGDQMDLLSETLHFDMIDYLLNDQFEEFSDKLINCIYINRYINDSYASINDWLYNDNTYSMLELNASMTDELLNCESMKSEDDLLRFFSEEIESNSNIMDMISLAIPFRLSLKKCRKNLKIDNSFGFDTELIVEYEQKVEN